MNFIIDSPTKREGQLGSAGSARQANPTDKSEPYDTDLSDSADMDIDLKFANFQTKPTKQLLSLSKPTGLYRSSTQPAQPLQLRSRLMFAAGAKKFKTDGVDDQSWVEEKGIQRTNPRFIYPVGKAEVCEDEPSGEADLGILLQPRSDCPTPMFCAGPHIGAKPSSRLLSTLKVENLSEKKSPSTRTSSTANQQGMNPSLLVLPSVKPWVPQPSKYPPDAKPAGLHLQLAAGDLESRLVTGSESAIGPITTLDLGFHDNKIKDSKFQSGQGAKINIFQAVTSYRLSTSETPHILSLQTVSQPRVSSIPIFTENAELSRSIVRPDRRSAHRLSALEKSEAPVSSLAPLASRLRHDPSTSGVWYPTDRSGNESQSGFEEGKSSVGMVLVKWPKNGSPAANISVGMVQPLDRASSTSVNKAFMNNPNKAQGENQQGNPNCSGESRPLSRIQIDTAIEFDKLVESQPPLQEFIRMRTESRGSPI